MTKTVYIGTASGSVEERWAQLQLAMELPIKAPLYKDMRDLGVECFTAQEYAFAENRTELAELFEEAMAQYNGTSLKGLKTTDVNSTSAKSSTIKKVSLSSSKTVIASAKTAPKATASKLSASAAKPKLATGRTGSAIKERSIKEAIAKEKEQRESLKSSQIADQADEMKAIMARLDSRGSSLRKR